VCQCGSECACVMMSYLCCKARQEHLWSSGYDVSRSAAEQH
jgi:hypothetical protein